MPAKVKGIDESEVSLESEILLIFKKREAENMNRFFAYFYIVGRKLSAQLLSHYKLKYSCQGRYNINIVSKEKKYKKKI